MTTPVYAFICTKTTADVALPKYASSQEDFNRRTSDAFRGLAGGHYRVGQIAFFPKSDAVPNHLLADGTILSVLSFPELGRYLGDTFGGDGVTNFALPDYTNQSIDVPADVPAQDTTGGTVDTGGTVTQPSGAGQTGGTSGGNVPSGGVPPRGPNDREQ